MLFCYRTLTAQWPWVPSIGHNLQSFNGEVSKWVKKSQVGEKLQTNNITNWGIYAPDTCGKTLVCSICLTRMIFQIIYCSNIWFKEIQQQSSSDYFFFKYHHSIKLYSKCIKIDLDMYRRKSRNPWASSLTWEIRLKSIVFQSYDYIKTRKKPSNPFWMILICKTLSPLHQRMLCGKFV